jgi:hypothetical protein
MFRKIAEELKNKHYAVKAGEVAYYDEKLCELLKKELRKSNPLAADSVRSVVKIKNSILIRAKSRSAMSELYVMRPLISKILHQDGVGLRFLI